ncbi:MAG TPA: hypothetical protein PLZ55_10045 [bacterium]|nr:hypothetical protein [bacterium]HPO08997.1 hypothetical protein [bacterium]HQO33167.1 hypothetical protein [bacterium]HQP99933.1 hypothetical protein [bacterium]
MRREFGIKARHMTALEEDPAAKSSQKVEDRYTFVVLSDKPGRIISFLQPVLAEHGKFFEFRGFDLYREGLKFATTPEGGRTVSLVLTDGPEDRKQPSESGLELWKETVFTYGKAYTEHFVSEILNDHLPAVFTVVVLFNEKLGRLSYQDFERLEAELKKSEAQKLFHMRSCQSEEELANCVDEDFMQRVLTRHHVSMKIKQSHRDRDDRIARATKATKEALHRKAGM